MNSSSSLDRLLLDNTTKTKKCSNFNNLTSSKHHQNRSRSKLVDFREKKKIFLSTDTRQYKKYLLRSRSLCGISSICEEQSTTSSWITGGKIGSKDAVLVFNVSALNRGNDKDNYLSSKPQIIPSTSVRSLLTTSPKEIKVLKPLLKNNVEQKLSNKKLMPYGVGIVKKRTHDSLSSSSENSISSVCDADGDDDDDDGDDDVGDDNDDDEVNDGDNDDSDNDDVDPKAHLVKINTNILLEKENMSRSVHRLEQFSNSPDFTDMPANNLKITYKFVSTETKLLRKILSSHGLTETSDNHNFSLLWTGVHMKPDILRNLAPYQRVNHFPRSYELTRKDRLYKNIEKMQHLRGLKHFDFIPLSFMLPLEYRDLLTAHRSGHRGPWIVKPAASSRGRGIFIVNTPDQIPLDEQVIVSKYVADPLCIDGHKCDVRIYVAVTSFNPLLIYMYEEGLVRLATVKYEKNAENLWNPCMHLCNYSINKYHSDYIKATEAFEDVGHKWTFSALLRHLKTQGCDTYELMRNIEDIIIKSIFACSQSIVSACRMFVPNINNCFELYGFDILIDDTLKPWLLETNLSPSLGIDTPLDARVKASLITDLLTLIGIPALSQLTRAVYDSKSNRFKTLPTNHNSNNSSGSNKCSISNEMLSNGSNNNNSGSNRANNKRTNLIHQLSADELRIVRNFKAQYKRRGGFLCIYPSDDSIQKYGMFLDSTSGIPISTISATGTNCCPTFIPHNYNLMLHTQLYQQQIIIDQQINIDVSTSILSNDIVNNFENRMNQYERPLQTLNQPIHLGCGKQLVPKSLDEAKKLRKQIRKLIENGLEMSQLQSRRAFSQYLECILRRLTQEPKSQHEKLILKFIARSSGMKPPSFMKNTSSSSSSLTTSTSSTASQLIGGTTTKIPSKDRSAIVAKLLGDYLEMYNRDTDTYEDNYDHFGYISISTFNEFLAQAQEFDLESILTLHTNFTQFMPFLYNRNATSNSGSGGGHMSSSSSLSPPIAPPIPTGQHGFLKALPSMAPNITSKDILKIDLYYRSICDLTNCDQDNHNTMDGSSSTGTKLISTSDKILNRKKCDKIVNKLNTGSTLGLASSSTSSSSMQPLKKKTTLQTTVQR